MSTLSAALATAESRVEAKAASSAHRAEVQVGSTELIDRLAPEWRRLCDANSSTLPYQRPEWYFTYLRHLEPAADLRLVTVRRGEQLVAVLPLQRERTRLGGVPLTRMRAPGDNSSPYPFDLAYVAGERDASVAAAWSALRATPGWDLLELADVPTGSALDDLYRLALTDRAPAAHRATRRSPILTIPAGATFEQTIATTDGRFRGANRRHLRKLQELGEVRFVKIQDAELELLDRFFELEASGWKGDAGTAIAADQRMRAYFTDLAREAAEHGYLTLYAILLDGVPISMQFGFTMNGTYAFPKCAYDERYRDYAPGHLIVNEIIRDLVDTGVREFDFMGIDSFWKTRWTKDVRAHRRLFIFRPSPVGRAAHTSRFHLLPIARRTSLQTKSAVRSLTRRGGSKEA